jgi:hypothetical protein
VASPRIVRRCRFATGQYAATLDNLTGSSTHVPVTPPATDVPPPLPTAIDAGYPTPTIIALTLGGPQAPGLFTKPAIAAYPQYLKDACAEELSQVPQKSCTTILYKSATRADIESQGYDIVGNFGDQFQRPHRGLRRQDVQAAEPELLPPVTPR